MSPDPNRSSPPITNWKQRRFLRVDGVLAIVPFGLTKLETYIRNGKFPKPTQFGGKGCHRTWFEDEIYAWLAAEIDRRDGKAA